MLNPLAREHAQRGEALRLAGDLLAAQAAFDTALILEPSYRWALAHRGATACQRREYAAALADLNQALLLDPSYAWAWAYRGETYAQLEDYAQALADFDRALALNPKASWAVAHRGMVWRWLGDYVAARADFVQAITLDPQYDWAWAYLSVLDLLLGHSDEAYLELCHALELNPQIMSQAQAPLQMHMSRYQEMRLVYAAAMRNGEALVPTHLAHYELAVALVQARGLAAGRDQIARTRVRLNSRLNDVYYELAGLAALEGDNETSFRYLARIPYDAFLAERLESDSVWLHLHSDPRWHVLQVRKQPPIVASE